MSRHLGSHLSSDSKPYWSFFVCLFVFNNYYFYYFFFRCVLRPLKCSSRTPKIPAIKTLRILPPFTNFPVWSSRKGSNATKFFSKSNPMPSYLEQTHPFTKAASSVERWRSHNKRDVFETKRGVWFRWLVYILHFLEMCNMTLLSVFILVMMNNKYCTCQNIKQTWYADHILCHFHIRFWGR